MFRVEDITSETFQQLELVLPDGTLVTVTIYFVPMQYGWFITELTYGDFILRGFRISNGPNILRQFKNQIPFGLQCISEQDREPTLQEDFSSNASKLYILDQADVALYEDFLSGQV